MQNLDLAVMLPTDIDAILDFERARLAGRLVDAMERELFEWAAPWRREALEHYLPLGWSFGARDPETRRLRGYFLAQPFLFYKAMTQTLYVEHLSFDAIEIAEPLLDLAVRWGRDKHMQKVNLGVDSGLTDLFVRLNASSCKDQRVEISTTRIRS